MSYDAQVSDEAETEVAADIQEVLPGSGTIGSLHACAS
jgi:hypothetical protein